MDKYGFSLPPTINTATSMGDKYGFTLNAPSIQTKPSLFASTKESISHLVSDPLSLKEKISDAIPEAWNTIKDSVMQEKENISSFFQSKTAPQFIGTGLKTIAGGAGVVFSPLTAFFKAAENVPVLGTASKIVGIAFGAAGEGGAAVGGGVIDALPISQEAKDAIKPGMEEISALATQLALGRVLGKGKVDKLQQKYGAEDTQTILTEARKLAADESFKIKAIEPTQTIASKVETQLATPKIESSPLAQEATKYKSAEEFVNSKNKLYRGGGIYDPLKMTDEGVSLSYNKTVAEKFDKMAKAKGGLGNIEELYVEKNSKILDASKVTLKDVQQDGYEILGEVSITDYARKRGYDAIDFTKRSTYNGVMEDELKVINPNIIKTKSQLTDIWNKANKGEVKPIINLTPKKVMAPREKPVITEPIKLTENFDLTKPDSPEYLKAQHESEVLAELEVSEKGWRANVNGEQISAHSTMPGFIPDELRSNALIKTVLGHIKNNTLPTKANEIRLYNVIRDEMNAWEKVYGDISKELNVDEIDFLSSTDETKLINEKNNILKQYDKAPNETIPASEVAGNQPVAQKIQKPEGTGKLKTSGLAETLKRDTIAKGVEADFGELPQYRVRPVKTQEALDFIRKNPELADKIIAGEIAPPEGLLTGEIYSAMKTEAIGLGDTQVLIKLSKAKANDIATMFGREIKAFDANMEIDPVRAIRELNRIKTDKAIKPKKDIINQAKQVIKKSVSKRETWNEFIKSLECK